MEKTKAKILLSLYRKGELLETDPLIIKALQLMEDDPTLMTEVEEEKAFDQHFKNTLLTVFPPDNLKEKILSSYSKENKNEFSKKINYPWLHFSGFGIAAAIIVLLALNFTFWNPPIEASTNPDLNALIRSAEYSLRTDGPRMVSREFSQLASFLQANGKDIPTNIPSHLKTSNLFACDVFTINNVQVGLLCFKENDMTYHLFSFNSDAIPSCKKMKKIVYSSIGNKSCASWKSGGTVYFLLAKTDKENLKTVLEI